MSLFPRNRVLVGALALALTMLVPALPAFAAKPGNSLNAKACYKGGWITLYSGNGVSFASQDECVANGAHGGTYGPAARVFAIAFTNLDGVAGFTRGADVLIAELVDSNRDNVVNAGDTVHMGSYPLDFAATSFGTFGVTSHPVTSVVVVAWFGAQVASDGDEFSLGHGTFFEFYGEGVDVNAPDQSDVIDSYGAGCDFVNVATVSPSVPSVAVALTPDCDTPVVDNSFIDVTLNLP